MTLPTRLVSWTVLALVSVSCAVPGRKIDVDGCEIHVRTAGRGEPTVVFDSGLGDPMGTWFEVWPAVAELSRVFLWDRPGLGASAPRTGPRTSGRIVEELRAALDRAGVPGPYVLVGHSFGGLDALLFASRYPDDVAGLVLVDATHEEFPARERELRPTEEQARIRTTLSLAPPAALAEFEALEESAREVRQAPPPPDVPAIVIRAGSRGDPEELERTWNELQEDLVARFPRGRLIVASDSGHYVQYDAPDVVIEAIGEVLEAARRDLRGSPAPTVGRRAPNPSGRPD